MSGYTDITVTLENYVATVEIQRPPHNFFDYSLIGQIADAFDAMTSNRSYARRLTLEQAIDELLRGKGTQFDPIVVDAMLAVMDRGETGK